jgi:DNA-binding transcriptional regulator YiaG
LDSEADTLLDEASAPAPAPPAKPAEKSPGKELREIRLALGMTQPEFAKALGAADATAVSRMESGKADPSAKKLLPLAWRKLKLAAGQAEAEPAKPPAKGSAEPASGVVRAIEAMGAKIEARLGRIESRLTKIERANEKRSEEIAAEVAELTCYADSAAVAKAMRGSMRRQEEESDDKEEWGDALDQFDDDC